MATTWTGSPLLSAASINELRQAVEDAGGNPFAWTGGNRLATGARVLAAHVLEIKVGIQSLWNDRGLGLIPNWTTGVEPGLPAPTYPSVLIRDVDILNLRSWFNHYESWGDLRGVHWWKPGVTPALPTVGWNVESVIALRNANNEYDSGAVDLALSRCTAARNYGLVNIVRLDWKAKHAAPLPPEGYDAWITLFTRAVNTLKGVANIFIVGNEPNIEAGKEWKKRNGELKEEDIGLRSFEYAIAFNRLYSRKVAGTKYLAAGPAILAHNNRDEHDEADRLWLERVKDTIDNLDGWSLHTYGAPYLDYAGATDDADERCDEPSDYCPVSRDDDNDDEYLVGDAGFRRYSEYIDIVRGEWPTKPIYITETNTSGYKRDDPDFNKPTPIQSYVTGWIQKTYTEIRGFNLAKNMERTTYPPILCLCWFVDSDRDSHWADFALSKSNSVLEQARSDFIASNTSTGIAEEAPISGLGGAPTHTVDAGVTRLAAFIK